MTEAFTINVDGRLFSTLKSARKGSPFSATMLSSQWAGSTCYINGVVVVVVRVLFSLGLIQTSYEAPRRPFLRLGPMTLICLL
jgi:hypothetical protein